MALGIVAEPGTGIFENRTSSKIDRHGRSIPTRRVRENLDEVDGHIFRYMAVCFTVRNSSSGAAGCAVSSFISAPSIRRQVKTVDSSIGQRLETPSETCFGMFL